MKPAPFVQQAPNSRGAEASTSQELLPQLRPAQADHLTRTALSIKKDGRWEHLSYGDLTRQAKAFSNCLIECGVGAGTRVSLLLESGPQWSVAFFAVIRAGATVVPLDIKLTAAELAAVITDAASSCLVVSSSLAETAWSVLKLTSCLKRVLTFDEGVVKDLITSSVVIAGTDYVACERMPDETALIVYTSSTTGYAKGAMISFANLVFQAETLIRVMRVNQHDRVLSILPLHHLLELTGGLLTVLRAGGEVCFTQTLLPAEITTLMREKKVTRMVVVPLFLKLLKEGIEREIRSAPTTLKIFFSFAFAATRLLRASWIKRLIFYPVHQRLGGRFRHFISGGAPLDAETSEFFDRLGIPVYQGYGLTEASPVVTVNTPRSNRLGSVGRALPGVEVTLLSRGNGSSELLTRGPHVMKGYNNRPDLTQQIIDAAGWLHTGDIAMADDDGFFYIRGRIKNMIVLGSGKKVHPEEVEAVLSHSALLKDVCVLGRTSKKNVSRGHEEVCAVAVPSDLLKNRCSNDRDPLTKEIGNEVTRLARQLAPYKRPTRVHVYSGDLPKTATLKVKRALLHQWLDSAEDGRNE